MYENIPSQLCKQFVENKRKIRQLMSKLAVNSHIKLVTPDHKIAIKISYLIEFYFFIIFTQFIHVCK